MRTLHMLHELEVVPGETTSTVRKGFKWADLVHGEQLELCVCTVGENGTHTVMGHGVVVGLWFGKFCDISARAIANEHEVASRNYKGLLASMRRAYGQDFNEATPVTVVYYRRID